MITVTYHGVHTSTWYFNLISKKDTKVFKKCEDQTLAFDLTQYLDYLIWKTQTYRDSKRHLTLLFRRAIWNVTFLKIQNFRCLYWNTLFSQKHCHFKFSYLFLKMWEGTTNWLQTVYQNDLWYTITDLEFRSWIVLLKERSVFFPLEFQNFSLFC